MKKILVIEDNADIRENTQEILSLANYNVITAENGKIGVELASREKPDLIMCDIMMPELDGYGVLHILSKKPETAAIPFIFVTAKTERSDIRRGMELGADDYLTKPFDDTELLNAIETRFRKNEMRVKEYSGALGLESFIEDAKKALHLKDLCKDRKTRSVKKKNEIYAEGDTPHGVYFLQSGEVKSSKAHAEGKELITNLYKKDDFFGFEPILENTGYQESAIALQDSEIVVIPRQDFLTLIFSQPDVSASFISLLCKKVAQKEEQLINLAYSSVRQRTAEALLKTRDMKGDKDIKLSISREDLARMVGTASESVIRVLSEFRDEGVIGVEGGKIDIRQPAKLEKIVRWNVAR